MSYFNVHEWNSKRYLNEGAKENIESIDIVKPYRSNWINAVYIKYFSGAEKKMSWNDFNSNYDLDTLRDNGIKINQYDADFLEEEKPIHQGYSDRLTDEENLKPFDVNKFNKILKTIVDQDD